MASISAAKKYREKINPRGEPLPAKDILDIKNRIKTKVSSELRLRISKGYENIDLSLIDSTVDGLLNKTKVTV